MNSNMNDADIGTIYATAEHLERLEHAVAGLSLLSRQPHTSVLSGRYASRVRGRGLDFAELRSYVVGDDIRTIDWKASQRRGRSIVRSYTEERDRPLLLIVDQRMAMFFGSRRAMKSVVAAELCALGAWTGFHAGDRVGAIVFDDMQRHFIKPLRSRAQLQQLFGVVARINTAMHADSLITANPLQLNHALEAALNVAGHDHLVLIISDFAGADERTLQLLRELRVHNDVVAALITDPLGQNLPQKGHLVVSGGELQIEVDFARLNVREPLAAAFDDYLRRVAELLRRSGIPLLLFDTEQETLAQLRHQLGRMTPSAVRSGGMA